MKNRIKKIVYWLVTLNIVIITLYNYDRFVDRIFISYPSVRSFLFMQDLSIPDFDHEDPLLNALTYGERIEDHSLKGLNEKRIDISSANSKFKFIQLIQVEHPLHFKIDRFAHLLELKKFISDSDVEFIYAVVGKISTSYLAQFKEFEKTYGIKVVSMSVDFLKENYHLPYCGCGFYLLLDGKNQVRVSLRSIPLGDLKLLISKEMKRNLNE